MQDGVKSRHQYDQKSDAEAIDAAELGLAPVDATPDAGNHGDAAPPKPAKPRAGPTEVLTWLDYMRVTACLLVVLGHCSASTREMPVGKVDFMSWEASVVYSTIHRISVPLFFMMSGFLMLFKTENLGDFYRKRIPRIVIPMIAWDIIYIFVQYKTQGRYKLTVSTAIQKFFFDFGNDHLWFLYATLGLYLATPMLRPMMRHTEPKVLVGAIVIWFLSDPLGSTVNRFFGVHPPLLSMMQFPRASVGFFMFGGIAKMYPVLSKKTLLACAVIYVATALSMVAGTTYAMLKTHKWYDAYLAQNGVFVALISLTGFLLLRAFFQTSFFERSPRLSALMRHFADQTYGIYLCHMLFVNPLSFFFDPTGYNGVIRIPVLTFAATFMSYVFVITLRKIPVLKQIVE
eukprot:TRINITY_DN22596_c0_g1_i1.p2 TRINITY_DN22596_c0_g1~~TRINITY_DN22596_c0_g1_i1.p2  ORF type:complete len:401 (-),score=144.86 TRINITY_DN22596_c0_g1_i1:356-1558(-)